MMVNQTTNNNDKKKTEETLAEVAILPCRGSKPLAAFVV